MKQPSVGEAQIGLVSRVTPSNDNDINLLTIVSFEITLEWLGKRVLDLLIMIP